MSRPEAPNPAEEARAVKALNELLLRAQRERASDIHLEPRENYLRVRYRIDGLLAQRPSVLEPWRMGIINRIKVLANLDIAERRLPQDGAFQVVLAGMPLGYRVSTFPTEYGEKVVLRALGQERPIGDFESLGMSPAECATLRRLVVRKSGMLLACGPAGSGKTSTLYAILAEIQSLETNIVTLEDPIEHRFDGITQGQVNARVKFDFEAGLRAILRQDPDVIMVGEMRDRETASIAFKAALTGHLVLSTLHTESAAEAVVRLADMGLERYIVGSTLRGVVAQRLVRKLCPHCRRPVEADARVRELLGHAGPEPLMLYEPGSCARCASTGFHGRTGLFEILEVDEPYAERIKEGAGKGALDQAIRARGIPSLREAGWRLVREGVTTVREILRVV